MIREQTSMVHCPHCGNKLSVNDILFSKHDAFYKGRPLGLTVMERRMLKIMWETDFVSDRNLSRAENTPRAVAAMISRMRAKLMAVGAPYVIRKAEGGYTLQPLIEGVNDWAVRPGHGRSRPLNSVAKANGM